MNDIDVMANPSSPANALSYVFSDADTYFDSTNTSTSASPMNSPYDLAFQVPYPGAELSSEESCRSETRDSTSKPAAKRKRENRYKNAPPSVLSRRRAQNRASQRAYRERKDQRIKDLEVLLTEAQQKNNVLTQAYSALQAEYVKLKNEQDVASQFQQTSITYDSLMNPNPSDMDMYLYSDTSNYSDTSGYTV